MLISNTVAEVVVWDGVAEWQPPSGCEMVALAADEPCGSGWTYEEGATPRFIAPLDIPPEE